MVDRLDRQLEKNMDTPPPSPSVVNRSDGLYHWLTVMPWFKQNNAIEDALAVGDLSQAMQLLRGLKINRSSRCWRQQLTLALIERANQLANENQLADAWQDCVDADQFADDPQGQLVAKLRDHLVDQAATLADAMVRDGRASQAVQLASLIEKQGIDDQRIDRIRQVAEHLVAAERMATTGNLDAAIDSLTAANVLYPQLAGLRDQIKTKQDRQQQLAGLTDELQAAALACRWDAVITSCDSILEIAAQHELAIGARKHAAIQMKRRTSVGSRKTSVPPNAYSPKDASAAALVAGKNASPSDQTLAGPPDLAEAQPADTQQEPSACDAGQAVPSPDSFLIWVDGVGGYLVCTQLTNFVGQAGQGALVTIPLQADVRQRHARIETIDGQHLVQPLGPIQIDGRDIPLDESQILRNGQRLILGQGVELAYTQTHPLSKSARLDFISRHRTLPWSDGVILAGRSLIIGPNPNNHIYCPRWSDDLILYRRESQWHARCNKAFCIDTAARSADGPIGFNSHLVGDDFSLTLEPVA